MIRRALVLLGALAIALGILLIPTVASAAPYCGITWGSQPKELTAMGTGEVDTVRAGQHDCYDRVVIDIDGPPAGYSVRYVPEVRTSGSGAVVTTSGGARLQLTVHHPSFAPVKIGSSVANVSGYKTLRSVVYAGSFEGYTDYGVGVRARLPFRVFTIPGGHGRIVLDIAHQW